MKKLNTLCISILSLSTICFSHLVADPNTKVSMQDQYYRLATEPGSVMFTPPEGWDMADPRALPKSVKLMVVGKGQKQYPPSINLSVEKYDGTLKQYLKLIKGINESQGAEWKDLGSIKTLAGEASLSQIDTRSEWGDIRMMHVIFPYQGNMYIMTSAAPKEDFSKFYKDFFKAMKSLRINKSVYDMVTDRNEKVKLERYVHEVKAAYANLFLAYKKENSQISAQNLTNLVFESENFQKNHWQPFKEKVSQEYLGMGVDWLEYLFADLENDLVKKNSK